MSWGEKKKKKLTYEFNGHLTLSQMGGGAYMPPQPLIYEFLKILPYEHVFIFNDFSCISILDILQKTRAFYVPRLIFDSPFLIEDPDFQIVKFLTFWFLCKILETLDGHKIKNMQA